MSTQDSKVDTGSPAFPFELSSCGPHTGMTLLDWFAGKALAGMLAANTEEGGGPLIAGWKHPDRTTGPSLAECYAKESYAFAAAMIAEKRRIESSAP